MPRIRTVVFDCYGTLIDILTDEGKDLIYDHLSLYLRYYGANINASSLKSLFYSEKERYMNTRGERYPEFDMLAVFKKILEMHGLNHPFLVESCCKQFRLLSREKFRLFPDSLPVLKELKSHGYFMVMASNAQDAFFYAEIDILGLRQFFNYFVVSSYWGFRKPDPRIFSLACSLSNVLPTEAVYIGDDTNVDIKGAGQIGMHTVLVDRGQKQKNQEPKPDYYATNLQEAEDWLINHR